MARAFVLSGGASLGAIQVGMRRTRGFGRASLDALETGAEVPRLALA